jgi:hypothetical protein
MATLQTAAQRRGQPRTGPCPTILAVDGEIPDADALQEAVSHARRTHERILLLVAPPRPSISSSFTCYIACFVPPPPPPDGTTFAREIVRTLPADVPVTITIVEFGFWSALRRELVKHPGAHLVLASAALRRRRPRRRLPQ